MTFMVFTMLLVTILIFGLSRARGDPRLMLLDDNTTQETWDTWGEQMGLDRPLIVQYLVWLGKAVQGDLGKSLWENC